MRTKFPFGVLDRRGKKQRGNFSKQNIITFLPTFSLYVSRAIYSLVCHTTTPCHRFITVLPSILPRTARRISPQPRLAGPTTTTAHSPKRPKTPARPPRPPPPPARAVPSGAVLSTDPGIVPGTVPGTDSIAKSPAIAPPATSHDKNCLAFSATTLEGMPAGFRPPSAAMNVGKGFPGPPPRPQNGDSSDPDSR